MLLPTNLSAQELLYYESQKKNMGVAYLLWFFVGGLGVHCFYMDKTRKGVLYLVLSLIGWATVWIIIGIAPLIVVGVLWLIDAFTLHADVDKHNMLLLQHIQQGSKDTITGTPAAENL